jgi:dihydroceramidase
VAQPANAWSSLAFVLAGLWIAQGSIAIRGKSNRMVGEPIWRCIYGYALVTIGLGSYFYHASLTFAGQVCDMSGMYLLITFALLYGLARRTRMSTVIALTTYLLCNLALMSFQVTFPDLRRYVFATLVLGVVVMEAGYRGSPGNVIASPWLWRATAAMGVAFAVWVLDITKAVCTPGSLLQGHALWHILCASAGWCLYRYYESQSAVLS